MPKKGRGTKGVFFKSAGFGLLLPVRSNLMASDALPAGGSSWDRWPGQHLIILIYLISHLMCVGYWASQCLTVFAFPTPTTVASQIPERCSCAAPRRVSCLTRLPQASLQNHRNCMQATTHAACISIFTAAATCDPVAHCLQFMHRRTQRAGTLQVLLPCSRNRSRH